VVSEEILNAFRTGSLVLDCVQITLTQRSTTEPKVYTGKGEIRLDDDEHLTFKLYVVDQQNIEFDTHLREMMSGVAGEVHGEETYYDLSVKDLAGHVWTSERLHRQTFTGVEGDTIVKGALRYIKTDTESRLERHFVSVETFKPLDFPSRVARVFSPVPVESDFELSSVAFKVRMERDRFLITATAADAFDEDYYLRIVEALKFVTAKPVQPRIVKYTNGNTTSWYLLSVSKTNPRIQQFPPLSPTSWAFAGRSIDLFCRYLEYIENAKTREQWHPMTFFLDNAAQATGGSWQSWGAGLGMAIEGLLTIIPVERDEAEVSANRALRDWVVEQVAKDERYASFAPRVQGLLGPLFSVGPQDRLQHLVDTNVIDKGLKSAWRDLRNSSVHPDAATLTQGLGEDPQKQFRLISCATALMYQVVFHIIGYSQTYTDYATLGFPEREVRVEIEGVIQESAPSDS
jgi:hypothetical protein